ncbi:MAG: hypothetical protein IKN63_00420 [Bacilli bacterium]|nr:hypothetical protein [Bacilli bacterium]
MSKNKNIDDNLKNDKYEIMEYLTLKKMYEKIVNSGKSALELEDEIYSKDNITLTEEEKIYFEVKRILNKVTSNYELKYISKKDKKLYSYMSNLINLLTEFKKGKLDKNDVLKKEILKTEIYLNMKTGLYSVVRDMLKDYDDYKGVLIR